MIYIFFFQTVSNLKIELSEAKSNVNQADRTSKSLDDVQALLDLKVSQSGGNK